MSGERFKWFRWFRAISLAEGVSFLILIFLAMPLKYIYDIPIAVMIFGWIHGLLFILYIASIIPTSAKLKWSFSTIILAFAASILPFGPFIFDRRYLKSFKSSI